MVLASRTLTLTCTQSSISGFVLSERTRLPSTRIICSPEPFRHRLFAQETLPQGPLLQYATSSIYVY